MQKTKAIKKEKDEVKSEKKIIFRKKVDPNTIDLTCCDEHIVKREEKKSEENQQLFEQTLDLISPMQRNLVVAQDEKQNQPTNLTALITNFNINELIQESSLAQKESNHPEQEIKKDLNSNHQLAPKIP